MNPTAVINDIIIGSDVGGGMASKEDLNSISSLLFQAAMLTSNIKVPENIKLCDIFIDHEESKQFIHQQLKKLIKRAKRKGTALAIAHPKRITLSVLESWLPTLEAQGIKLVPVSTLIGLQQQQRLALLKPSLLNNTNAAPKRVKN